MDKKTAYKLTGLVALFVGILFFLRDIKINLVGDTSGWTIVLILAGAGLLAGDFTVPNSAPTKKGKAK